jgi:hypothetical protein
VKEHPLREGAEQAEAPPAERVLQVAERLFLE